LIEILHSKNVIFKLRIRLLEVY